MVIHEEWDPALGRHVLSGWSFNDFKNFSGWPGAVCALLAAGLVTAGVVIERWLFFAEATHTVTLYHGAQGV